MTKKFLDWSEFSSNAEALDLLKESMREGLDFDAYGNTNRFIAIALTVSQALSDVEAEGYGDPYTGPTMGKGLKHKFKARILGDHSPHMFLPDPCSLSQADANAPEALSAITQHTDFIQLGSLNGHYSAVAPGDIVEVELKKNVFSYDLQVGKFIRLVARNAAATSMLADLKCTNMAKDFYSYKEVSTEPTYDLSSITTTVEAAVGLNKDFTEGQVQFLTALAARVSEKLDSAGNPLIQKITVTDGVRTIKEQAQQMQKILRDSEVDFDTNYGGWGHTATTLKGYGSSPTALPAWTALLAQYYSRMEDPPGHVGGRAVDLATQKLSGAQLTALQLAIQDLGGTIHAEKKERWKKRGQYFERDDTADGYNEHWHVRVPAKFTQGLLTGTDTFSSAADTDQGVFTLPTLPAAPVPSSPDHSGAPETTPDGADKHDASKRKTEPLIPLGSSQF
jgi:hypothetical protein